MNATSSLRGAGSWWRDNGLWLLGAALLIALVFGKNHRDAVDRHQHTDPRRPIDVPAGQFASYEGARWRLLDVKRIDRREPGLRPDASLLIVHYEVVADAGTSADALNTCNGRLSAPDERYWEGNPLTLSRYRLDRSLSTRCGSRPGPDFKTVQAQPGQSFQFVHLYQIPRTQPLQGLRAEIRMTYPKQEAKGTYLRFGLPVAAER